MSGGIQIRAKEFITAIEAANAAIRKDTITPVFQSIRVRAGRTEAGDGEVSVLANAYDASVRSIRECKNGGGETVDAVVDYESFLASVKSIGGDDVFLRNTNTHLIVSADKKNSFRAKIVDGEILDPEIGGDVIGSFRVDAGEWKRAVLRAKTAVIKSPNNEILTGIHVAVVSGESGTSIVVEAANSAVASRVRINGEADHSGAFGFTLPADLAEKIAKLETIGGVRDWNVTVYENGVRFSGDRVEATSGILSGEYPDISRIMPNPDRYTVVMNRVALSLAIKRARLFSDDGGAFGGGVQFRRIRFSVYGDPEKGYFMRVSGSGEFGETSDDVPVEFSKGHEAEDLSGFYHIYFNSVFLARILKFSTDGDVVFRFGKPTDGALFQEFTYPEAWEVAIMPMYVE